MKKFLWGLLLVALLPFAAAARDGYQDRPHVCDMPSGPRLVKCQAWISTVQRPDYRGSSCCGDGDAFIADNFELGPNGELYAIISQDYPGVATPDPDLDDGSQYAPAFGVHKGDRILIPPEKRNHDPADAGNTSGHGVVFLMPSNGQVLCYFAPPLT